MSASSIPRKRATRNEKQTYSILESRTTVAILLVRLSLFNNYSLFILYILYSFFIFEILTVQKIINVEDYIH